MMRLYFLFDVFNIFLGSVLGGSLSNSLKTITRDPSRLPRAIGAALPTTSNFWLNYMVRGGGGGGGSRRKGVGRRRAARRPRLDPHPLSPLPLACRSSPSP